MEPAAKNYDIHDKELLAVVETFKHCRPYCHRTKFPILVFTDHQNLRYFTTSKVLNQRQVHWAEKLSEFDFRIVYQAGSKNRKPDARSRCSEYAVVGEGEPITLIKLDQIVIAVASMHPLLIKRLDDNAKLPTRGSDLVAGIDIMANQDMIIPPGGQSPISTGITLAVPPGTYTRIAFRSGLAVKHGIDIGAGVIDEDYRGEIKVVLINNSTIPFQIRPGDRVAQLILEKILRTVPEETKNLSETIRESQGFGSTGLEEILNTRTISSIKAIKFHPEFCQRVRTKSLQDDRYQLFINTQLEDKD
jgi:dUTP pyrophosphatase